MHALLLTSRLMVMALATTYFTGLISASFPCFHPCYYPNISPRWKLTPPCTPSTIYLAKMRKFNHPAEPSSTAPSSSSSSYYSSALLIDSNFSSTQYTHHGNIVKILKRNPFPTVVLPIGDNNADFIMNGNTDNNANYNDGHSIPIPTTATTTTTTNSCEIDHYFMGMALQQARCARNKGEVPIGAVIVKECIDGDNTDNADASSLLYTAQSSTCKQPRRTYQILAAGHNQVETTMDASAHAELVALRQGAKTMRNWRYPPTTTLYSTLEPCPICLASIQAFRIDHVVYGALDHRLGAITSHVKLLNVAKHPYHEVKSTRGGVRETECGEIVKNFFRDRRRVNKVKKKNDEGACKDESQHHILKLSRQSKKPMWKRDHEQKVSSRRQQWKKDEMDGSADIGQKKLLKVPRLKRKPLRIYKQINGVFILLNFVKSVVGRRRE